MRFRWTHWWIVGAMLGTAACSGGMGADGDGATDARAEAGADAHTDGGADAGQDVAMDHAMPDVSGDTGMDASDVVDKDTTLANAAATDITTDVLARLNQALPAVSVTPLPQQQQQQQPQQSR